jgi:acetamidase/formamidase
MALYEIVPERRTLHGKFSREWEPVLTINSGDTVRFQTLDAGWNIEPRTSTIPTERPRKFEPRDPDRDAGHALCGPVFIEGALPGMTLEVQIGEIRPGPWGWVVAGGWDSPVNQRLGVAGGEEVLHLWTLDAEAMTGRNQHGHEVALRPFLGVLGMPEDVAGLQSTTPPRITGGNLDCKELVTGSSLFLPIAVPGGLFSVGDGHATQADGEVSGLAIECPMERVDLAFRLHPHMSLTTPRANTPAGWITLGLDEDLDEAMHRALDAMLDLMGETHGLERRDALALASLVVDLRITQVVNGVQGVHALLPHGALRISA